jgi:hypothetical protein
MLFLTPALILAGALGAVPGPPSDCRVTDLMPAFWAFWETAREKPLTDQYTSFVRMVQEPNAAVYEGIFRALSKPPAELVPRALERVPGIEKSMREISGRLAAELPRELAAFREAFPDFQCATPVYFLYSAGAFDGATREVSGRMALMFGLDVIARLDEQLSPLLVHELFHVYHAQFAGEGPDTFSWALWSEGLATYVSRRLNPDVPEEKACCLPPMAPAEAASQRLAEEALRLLDSKKPEDYARFFLGGDQPDIPSRSGYYLGYRIASAAGKTRALRELAVMKPAEVRALEQEELRRMASGPRPHASSPAD